MKQHYPHLTLCIFILCMLPHTIFAANKSNLPAAYFIENKGQVQNENGAAADNVLFYTAGGPMQMFLTTTGYSLVVKHVEANGRVRFDKIDFQLENVKLDKSQLIFADEEKPHFNYYIGSKHIEDVTGAQHVIVRNIYPGIDWLWKIDGDGQLEHEFMVGIGRDARQIKYKVIGANSMVGAEKGQSKIVYTQTAFSVSEGPIIYDYKGKDIPAQLELNGNNISYSIPDELKGGGFTIDPPINLQTVLGNDSTLDVGFRGIVTDYQGYNISVGYSGDFSLPVLPQVTGSYVDRSPSNNDVMIMKQENYRQKLIWTTFFGGSNRDEANAVAAHLNGIFVTGFSESWDFPRAFVAGSHNEAVQLVGRDAFIAKFNNDGKWQWATGYGGEGFDEATDIAYYNGKMYVTGYTKSKDFPVQQKSGAYYFQDTGRVRNDAFLLEFDTACALKWGTTFGGSGDDYMSSVYADATGIYTTGYSDTVTGAPIPLQSFGSAYFKNTFSQREAFVNAFTPGGALQWSTFIGTSGNDAASCISRSECGLFICGRTDGFDLPVQSQGGGDYYQPNYGGGASDGFIARFDANTLQKKYCTYYGGPGQDVINKFAINSQCKTIYTGSTTGMLPDTIGPWYYFHQDTMMNTTDAFMFGLDSTQKPFWTTYFGGPQNDYGNDVTFSIPEVVDMVGEGLYNYGNGRIGGTYRSTGCDDVCARATSNGVVNRFYNYRLGSGGGGGGGGGCGGDLFTFQALIPMKNTCPDQCNGISRIDTAGMGGCPPYTVLWNNGGHRITENSLCEDYWTTVIDANGQDNTIYGRFDVLRQAPLNPVATNCANVPVWKSIIQPQGGGPPYRIEYRGIDLGISCPTDAFFDIKDTANCVLPFKVKWYQYNKDLHPELIVAGDCGIYAHIKPANDECNDLRHTNSWKYVVYSATDTFIVPYESDKDVLIIKPDKPGYYYGYLDLGDCRQPMQGIYYRSKVNYKITKILDCQNAKGSIKLSIVPDSASIASVGSYNLNIIVRGLKAYYYSSQTVEFSSYATQQYNFYDLTGNDYSFSIYSNSCDSTGETVELKIINFTFNTPSALCGAHDSLIADVEGGTPPYTFKWSRSSVNSNAIGVSEPGAYTLTVSDTSGCVLSKSTYINGSPSNHIDSIRENQQPCAPGLNSVVTAFGSGGTGVLTYLWSNGETGSTAEFIPEGNAWVSVRDYYGCTDTLNFINTKAPKVQAVDTAIDITCFGYRDGKILLDIKYGYTPYKVKWSDGDSTSGATHNNLNFGNYSYTVTDARGCKTNGSASIDQPDSIKYVAGSGKSSCNAADGFALVGVTGGVSPFSIRWLTDNDTVFYKQHIKQGTYDFVLVDGRGCRKDGQIVVKDESDMYFTASIHPITCNNSTDGSATIQVFNAFSPVRYKWDTGNPEDTLSSVTNLKGGPLAVTVTDNKGCVHDTVLNIDNPNALEARIDSGLGIPCHGEQVFVRVVAQGGTYPYRGEVSGLYGPGTYNVSLIDSNGCTYDSVFSLTDPPAFYGDINVTRQPDCAVPSGIILARGFGGVGLYHFQIGTDLPITFEDSVFVPGVAPGFYSVSISDDHGCMVDTMAYINPYLPLVGGLRIVPPGCTGNSAGTITVSASGASPFKIQSNGLSFSDSIKFSNLAPGDYSYVIEDAQGCTDTLRTKLVVTEKLVGDYTITQPVVCFGDSASVLISVINGTPPISGTGTFKFAAGNFQQQLADTNGCAVTLNGFIASPADSLKLSSTQKYTTCDQQSTITLAATGGLAPYQLLGSTPETFFSSISRTVAAGLYTYQVKDSLGCMSSIDISAIAPDSFKVDANITQPACSGNRGSITLNVSGVGPFNVLGQSFASTLTYNNLVSGDYTYTVTDARGCSKAIDATLTEPSALVADYSFMHRIVCFGDQAIVNVFATGGNAPYRGTGTFTYSGGTFTQTVRDTTGCSVDVNIMVPAPTDSLRVTTQVRQATCTANAFVTVAVTGGSGYYRLYANGGVFPFTDSLSQFVNTGQYIFQVKDSFGCQQDVPLNIVVTDTIQGKIETRDRNCYGDATGAVMIVMTKGAKPFFTDGSSFNDTLRIGDVDPGPHMYKVRDSRGCEQILSGVVFQPEVLSIDSVLTQNPITCRGLTDATLTIKASGGTQSYRYTLYQDGDTLVNNSFSNSFGDLGAGIYGIRVLDRNGCLATSQTEVLPFVPHNNAIETTDNRCYGSSDGSIKIYSQPADKSPYTYSLNGGAGQFYNVYYSLPAGDYSVVVSDKYNCKDTLAVAITQGDSIDGRVWVNEKLLPFGPTVIYERTPVFFSKKNKLRWTIDFSPPVTELISTDTQMVVRPHDNTTYVVTIYQDDTDSSCFVQYTGKIEVIQVGEINNILTPNGDGRNDKWELDQDTYPDAEVTIVDRWGEVVFQSDHYKNDWDGTYKNGRHVPDGTYFYILRSPSKTGAEVKGNINVLNSQN